VPATYIIIPSIYSRTGPDSDSVLIQWSRTFATPFCHRDNLVEFLFLQNNQIVSIAQGTFSGMPKLRVLSIAGNYLNGGMPADINGLANLFMLDVHGNQINTIGPVDLPASDSLRCVTCPHSIHTLPEQNLRGPQCHRHKPINHPPPLWCTYPTPVCSPVHPPAPVRSQAHNNRSLARKNLHAVLAWSL
jgi:hypothetical protein